MASEKSRKSQAQTEQEARRPSHNNGAKKTIREKIAGEQHGPDANPSQLGDPVSLKAEASDNIPTDNEAGSKPTVNNSASSGHADGKLRNGETLREKAAKKIHGPDANPSQLGDPVSIKAETSTNIPTDTEAGANKIRNSKL